MLEIIPFLGLGLVLGLAAGITPGPLMTIIVSESLQHGSKAGVKIAMSPLLTDIPIVFASLFIVTKLSKTDSIIGAISILGAIVIGYYAYENLFKKVRFNLNRSKEKSLSKGVITNLFNPHLYVNSFTIHAPIMLKALQINILTMFAYFFGFMLMLVASKVVLAMTVGKSKNFIRNKIYTYTIKFLGIALLLFAILFLRDGLRYFNLI